MSGGVHKGEIKGKGKGCKRGGGTETGKTDTTGQKTHTRKVWKTQWNNGTNWNGKMEGAARIEKGEDTGTEGTHRKSTEDAQEATHENTSYILRWKPGRLGKDGAPTG